MSIEKLFEQAEEMARVRKAGGDFKATQGFKFAKLMASIFGAASELNAQFEPAAREVVLVELWPLICEAARNGNDSELSRRIQRIMAQ